MRVILLTAACLTAMVSGAPALHATAETTSPGLAKQLVSAMTARQLTAIAAVDPAEPGRYVAALAFPDVQLLVVSAKHNSEYLKMQLGKRQFQEVYSLLQESDPVGRLFFHDMGCDGLQEGENVDVLYEGKDQKTMFDGKWDAQSLSEEAYTTKRTAADAKYSHALTVLLEATKRLPVPTRP